MGLQTKFYKKNEKNLCSYYIVFYVHLVAEESNTSIVASIYINDIGCIM